MADKKANKARSKTNTKSKEETTSKVAGEEIIEVTSDANGGDTEELDTKETSMEALSAELEAELRAKIKELEEAIAEKEEALTVKDDTIAAKDQEIETYKTNSNVKGVVTKKLVGKGPFGEDIAPPTVFTALKGAIGYLTASKIGKPYPIEEGLELELLACQLSTRENRMSPFRYLFTLHTGEKTWGFLFINNDSVQYKSGNIGVRAF